MTIFKSHQPPLNIPSSLTAWDWLFDSPYSPLTPSSPTSAGPLGGYTNAVTGARLDYAQVRTLSTYLATALVKHHGLQPGETISLFSQNTIWYPIAMFGGLRAGAVISGASPAYGVEEMAYALKTAKARFLMTMEGSLRVAVEAAERVGLGRERVILLEGKVEGFKTVQELVEQGEREGEGGQVGSWKIPPGQRNGDVCGYLSFSSGTTGLPKAVSLIQCLEFRAVLKVVLMLIFLRTGHDIPPERDSPVSPDPTNHPRHTPQDHGRAATLPYHRPRPPIAPSRPP